MRVRVVRLVFYRLISTSIQIRNYGNSVHWMNLIENMTKSHWLDSEFRIIMISMSLYHAKWVLDIIYSFRDLATLTNTLCIGRTWRLIMDKLTSRKNYHQKFHLQCPSIIPKLYTLTKVMFNNLLKMPIFRKRVLRTEIQTTRLVQLQPIT